jgi:hypothetical protein
MTLKIETIAAGRGTIIRVIGKFLSEHINELKAQIDDAGSPTALDLDEASIVDVDAIRFFNACEDNGIEVLNRSLYVREWMLRERPENKRAIHIVHRSTTPI